MIEGAIKHEDSLGNKGVIESGDVQWMTAGSGIIHSEMPQQQNNMLWGFQLWANLPSNQKMTDPRYQEVKKEKIPEVLTSQGVKIRVICGEIEGTKGPVTDIVIDPEYLDVTIDPNTEFIHHVENEYKALVYVVEGKGYFNPTEQKSIDAENLVIFQDGEGVLIRTGSERLRFLFISGKPIGEPIAWRGPIVMNTQKELDIAFEEYRNGTFIKTSNSKTK
jgi:redox-sensitive bicupin YhaK (pirin superfamily)